MSNISGNYSITKEITPSSTPRSMTEPESNMRVRRKKENESKLKTEEHETERDLSCSLCLSKEQLMLTSCSLEIRNIKMTIQELIDDLRMDQSSGDPLALAGKKKQICRSCVIKINDFYIFKKTCSTKTTDSAIQENLMQNTHKKEKSFSLRSDIFDDNKTKKLIDVPNDDSTDFTNCPECAQFVTENNDYKVTHVNAETSHRCNICTKDFENHSLTLSHLEDHEYAELNMDGIKERGIDRFGCKECVLKDMSWEKYVEHMEIHEHERVTKMILKMKLFCFCCLKEAENLARISEELFLNGQKSEEKMNIADLLFKIVKFEEIKQISGMLICEECIDRAIAVSDFHKMYKKSNKTLSNSVQQLHYCLRATEKVNFSGGQAIKMRIHFDFNKNKPVETIDLDKLDTMSTTSSNDAQVEESVLSSCTVDLPLPEHAVKRKQKNKESILKSFLENGQRNETIAHVKPKLPNADKEKLKDQMYCKVCKDFMKHEDFKVHLKETKYKCPICDRSFCNLGANNQHMIKAHVSQRTRKCALCVKVLNNSEIEGHMEREHSIVKFVCDECNLYSYDKNALRKHILKNHNIMQSGPAKCTYCSQEFVTRCDSLKHKCRKIKCKITKLYNCCECSQYPCIHDKYLKKFTEEEHTKLEHTCLDCDFVYSKKSILIEHVNMSHLAYYNHVCSACGESLPSKLALKKHERLHKLKKGNSSNIEKKLKGNSSNIEKKLFPCTKCELDFATSEERIEHDYSHPIGSEHLCRICKKTFQKLRQRNKHWEEHKTCNFCDKVFRFKKVYAKHMLAHKRKIRKEKMDSKTEVYESEELHVTLT